MNHPVGRRYMSDRGSGYHGMLLPVISKYIADLPTDSRVLDAGCGNGYLSGKLLARGFAVTGVDVSESGVSIARNAHPAGVFVVASLEDPDLPSLLGTSFDAVVSSEVIEHLYSPSAFLANCASLLRSHGRLILTTPYHGYFKNLMVALAGRFDAHVSPDIEGGHIKFWSRRSLTSVLEHHGFCIAGFTGCGRLPFLWKSMVVCAEKAE